MTTTAKTIRTTSTRTPATGRGTVVRLATAAVLASMAATAAGGTAAAAPSAPLPTFTGYGNGTSDTTTGDRNTNGGGTTDSPLLSPKQVAATLGAGTFKEDWSSTKLRDNDFNVSPSSCVATYAPAMAEAYGATPEAVVQNILVDTGNDDVRITQAVVALASKSDVAAQMKATVKQFKACAGTTISFREDGSSPLKMTNGDPEINDDKTVLSLLQQDTKGPQTCERAVAGYRNAIIDVLVCGSGSTHGQGVAVAQALSDKVSSQKA
ncbi:sensor domain-containing protein [Mycobacterium sp. SMC-13]|uniref:sensor domain-containing protein n=1 Tax=Mycobacterium sp. SMC-13 TaxID=3381626 RepID=UPI003875E2C7